MTVKSDFSPAEWRLLRRAGPLAALYVLVAEPKGAATKGIAIAAAYGDVKESLWTEQARDRDLVETLATEGPDLDRDRFGSIPEDLHVETIRAEALAEVRRAAGVLEARATEIEIADFRQFVLWLARRVAEAYKEGAFLGRGKGNRVSPAEEAAIADVAGALGM